MFNILIIILLVFIISLFVFKELDVMEVIAETFVISLGGIGFLSFIFREYLDVGYGEFSFYIIFILTLALMSIVTTKYIKGDWTFIKNQLKNITQITKVDLILLFILSLLVFNGFRMPVRGWDAYSLYDSRGRAFADGLKQSDLESFTKYDDTNYLYYFSYPPMTSSIHAVLYNSRFSTPMFIYPMFYSAIIIFIYAILKKVRVSRVINLLILSIVVLNKLLLEQIYSSYTNLPMISFQICFIFFTIKYFYEKRYVYLLVAALSLGFSNWTRNLEPTFVAFLILSIFPILTNKASSVIKNIMVFIIIILISIAPKLLWANYIANSVQDLGGITPSLQELFYKLLNSLEIANLINVLFFMYQSLLPIIAYVVIIFASGMVAIKLENKSLVKVILFSLLGTVLMIFLIMLAGTLYFSMTFVWWKDIPGSFLRSNLVLVPLSAIVVAYTIKYLDRGNNNQR